MTHAPAHRGRRQAHRDAGRRQRGCSRVSTSCCALVLDRGSRARGPGTPAKGDVMLGFTAYHGVDAATHQQRVNDLAPAGFRPVALNVSGQPGDPRYAAVWVARSGPAWQAVHGMNAGDYQTRFDELTGHGYAPTIVTATGPAGGEIFAAVFEQ